MDEEFVTALNESCLDFSKISPGRCSKQHSVTPHKCQLCDKGMDLLKDLLTHSGVITEDRLYVCEICFKSFMLKTTLAQHILNHKEQKTTTLRSPSGNNESIHNSSTVSRKSLGKLMCKVCFKNFSNQHSLTRHMKIHSGTQQQYVCDICRKTFSYKHSLKRHKFHMHLNDDQDDQNLDDDVVLIT